MDAAELGLDISSLGDMVPLSGLTLETVRCFRRWWDRAPTVSLSCLGDMMIVCGDPGGVQGLMMQLAVSSGRTPRLDRPGRAHPVRRGESGGRV